MNRISFGFFFFSLTWRIFPSTSYPSRCTGIVSTMCLCINTILQDIQLIWTSFEYTPYVNSHTSLLHFTIKLRIFLPLFLLTKYQETNKRYTAYTMHILQMSNSFKFYIPLDCSRITYIKRMESFSNCSLQFK